jgi:hypothetical protein
MKDIMILLLVIIVVFLVWNSRVNLSGYVAPMAADGNSPISPDVIQAIIEKVQQTKPDEQPLETLFVNLQADGSYASRFMFYNTRKFLGSQYDVVSKIGEDGNVEIINMSESAKEDLSTGYQPDKYKPYKDIDNSSAAQLKALLATRPETPVVTDMRLGTRS